MTRSSSILVAASLFLAGTAQAQTTPAAPAPASSFPSGPVSAEPQQAPLFAPFDAPPENDRRVWADAAYLLGWVQGERLPALVTTSPAGTAQASAGVLGTSGVTTLFGGGRANTEGRSGIRLDAGYTFDSEQGMGVEGGVFVLQSASNSFAAISSGSPILARPFLDVTQGAQTAAPVAFPGVSTGSVLANDTSHSFFGMNADLSTSFQATPWMRFDALLGYQYLRYDERLDVISVAQPTSGPFTPGTTITSADDFSTRNVLNGIDLGLRTEFQRGPLTLDLLGKVAAGPVNRTVSILGTQQVNVPGSAPVTSTGGLLALSSNIGVNNSHTWTAAPQLGAQLGWDVMPNVRLTTGYSVLWLIQAQRPGEQVDLGINPGLIPPATAAAGSASRPAFLGVNSTVWVQALSVGLEVKY